MGYMTIVSGLLKVATALAAIIPPASTAWRNRDDLVGAADAVIKSTTGANTNRFQGPFSWDPAPLLGYVGPILGLGVVSKIIPRAISFVNKLIDDMMKVF